MLTHRCVRSTEIMRILEIFLSLYIIIYILEVPSRFFAPCNPFSIHLIRVSLPIFHLNFPTKMAELPQNVARLYSPNLMRQFKGQIGHEGLNIFVCPSSINCGSIWAVGLHFPYSFNYHGFRVKSDHLVQKGRIIIYIETIGRVPVP